MAAQRRQLVIGEEETMATVYIGNAVCDEHGNARGGQPGNQTGRELRKQAWYKNAKGWRVLRPKDAVDARKITYAMREAVQNMAIGYNQTTRNTLYTYASKVGFDTGRVTTLCETDCSALVRVCLAYAGIKVSNFHTGNEAAILLATGKFVELIGTEYTDSPDRLKAGDVLITLTKGHTAVVLNDGPKAEKDPAPEPDPEPDPGPAPEKKKMIRVKGTVRCREGNGTDYKQIRPTVGPKTNPSGTLPYRGQAEESPFWYVTEWQGRVGYISSKKNLTEIVEV